MLNTNFADAIVDRGNFNRTTPRGFSYEQLASTATFIQKNLVGMSFSENDLTGWNFSGQSLRQSQISQSNLTRANFSDADLTNVTFVLSSGIDTADFSDAIVNGAHFALTTLTKEQLYTTASYKQKDLSRTILQSMDLTAGDLHGQNLSNANLGGARLTGADFSGAIINGAAIGPASANFTAVQLYSTASYQQKNLRGISLNGNDLSGWDFSGQDLIQSNLSETVLNNANFSGADVRGGTTLPSLPTVIYRNTIRTDGRIRGLELIGTESLLVRDFEMAINVTQGFAMSQQGTLNLQLADATWGSKIIFTPSLIPDLGGVLSLSFAPSADLAALPGAVFDSVRLAGPAYRDKSLRPNRHTRWISMGPEQSLHHWRRPPRRHPRAEHMGPCGFSPCRSRIVAALRTTYDTLMNRTGVVALALVSILSLTTATARADLTFDLRAVSGSQIIIHSPKSVAVNQNSVGGWAVPSSRSEARNKENTAMAAGVANTVRNTARFAQRGSEPKTLPTSRSDARN